MLIKPGSDNMVSSTIRNIYGGGTHHPTAHELFDLLFVSMQSYNLVYIVIYNPKEADLRTQDEVTNMIGQSELGPSTESLSFCVSNLENARIANALVNCTRFRVVESNTAPNIDVFVAAFVNNRLANHLVSIEQPGVTDGRTI